MTPPGFLLSMVSLKQLFVFLLFVSDPALGPVLWALNLDLGFQSGTFANEQPQDNAEYHLTQHICLALSPLPANERNRL